MCEHLRKAAAANREWEQEGGGGLLEQVGITGWSLARVFPAYGDLQVLHLCSVLAPLPGNATHKGMAHAFQSP